MKKLRNVRATSKLIPSNFKSSHSKCHETKGLKNPCKIKEDTKLYNETESEWQNFIQRHVSLAVQQRLQEEKMVIMLAIKKRNVKILCELSSSST